MADSERQVIVRIRAEVDQFRSAMAQASQSAKDLAREGRAAGQQAQQGLGQATGAADDTAAALDAAGEAASSASDGLTGAADAAGTLAESTEAVADGAGTAAEGMDEAATAAAALAAAQNDAAAAAGGAGDAADQAGLSWSGLMSDAEEHGDAWEKTGETMLGFGATAVAAVGVAVAKYSEFDKAMSSVQAATHASADEMVLFREAAMVAGADTAYSAAEAANAIEELSKAGVSAKDILGGGLAGSLSLAAAGAMDVGDAAELAATAMTQFGLVGADIPHIADLLAAGAGKAQGSVHDLGMALNQSGLVAAATGVSIESATGTLAAFASAGLTGSDAGTSFKSMLQHLQAPSSTAATEMGKLGINMYDANGAFIGMTALAEQLQTNMSGLTQQERDHANSVIFGADAVRAANVLYEQGGEGIQEWTNKVNDAGYAATTAAIMQDNLAGDLEKLGGSFDTVFIKAGGSASEALRTLVQAGESAVDAIGKIPTPVLETGTAILGIVGSTALAGGAFLKLTPMVLDGIKSFKGLGTEGGRIPGTMGKIAKGATIAAVAIGALAAIGKATSKNLVPSMSEIANGVLAVSKSGKGLDELDRQFQTWGIWMGTETVQGVESLHDAVTLLSDVSGLDKFNSGVTDVFGLMGHPGSPLAQVRARFEQVGSALGDLVSNGAADTAAVSFNKLTKEFEDQGLSAQEALDTLPGYRDSLLDLGESVGVSLSDQELLSMAMGKVPASMEAAGYSVEGVATVVGSFNDVTGRAIPITEDMAEALADMGITAAGAVVELEKYAAVLVAAGLSTLSERDAQRAYKDTLDGTGEALAKNGINLDQNTAAGRENQAALDAVAGAGLNLLTSMSATKDAYGQNKHSQEELQSTLKQTYLDVEANAIAMGYGAEEAAALARETLGIPPEVNIDTWMSDYAKILAEETTGALATTGSESGDLATQLGTLHEQIQGLPDKEVIITEPMSPEVKAGLENLGYVVEHLPDGTIKVSETGTDATGQKIDDTARKERIAQITAQAITDAANTALNTVAQTRTATINATMNILRGRDDTAGWKGVPYMMPGGYTGGAVTEIMGMYSGGVIPGTPPVNKRQDNILALVNGRPLAVRSGEFLVNEDASLRHRPVLEAMNAGTFDGFTGGAPAPEYVPVSSAAPSGGGAAAGVAQFIGDLYLDSGEFLGKVQGVARQEADHVIARLDTTISHLNRGGVYTRRSL